MQKNYNSEKMDISFDFSFNEFEQNMLEQFGEKEPYKNISFPKPQESTKCYFSLEIFVKTIENHDWQKSLLILQDLTDFVKNGVTKKINILLEKCMFIKIIMKNDNEKIFHFLQKVPKENFYEFFTLFYKNLSDNDLEIIIEDFVQEIKLLISKVNLNKFMLKEETRNIRKFLSKIESKTKRITKINSPEKIFEKDFQIKYDNEYNLIPRSLSNINLFKFVDKSELVQEYHYSFFVLNDEEILIIGKSKMYHLLVQNNLISLKKIVQYKIYNEKYSDFYQTHSVLTDSSRYLIINMYVTIINVYDIFSGNSFNFDFKKRMERIVVMDSRRTKGRCFTCLSVFPTYNQIIILGTKNGSICFYKNPDYKETILTIFPVRRTSLSYNLKSVLKIKSIVLEKSKEILMLVLYEDSRIIIYKLSVKIIPTFHIKWKKYYSCLPVNRIQTRVNLKKKGEKRTFCNVFWVNFNKFIVVYLTEIFIVDIIQNKISKIPVNKENEIICDSLYFNEFIYLITTKNNLKKIDTRKIKEITWRLNISESHGIPIRIGRIKENFVVMTTMGYIFQLKMKKLIIKEINFNQTGSQDDSEEDDLMDIDLN